MIQDQTLAVQILDTMDLMTEALVELSRELSAGNTTAAFDLSCGLREMAARVCNLAPGLCAEEPELDLDKTSVSVYESIKALSCLSPDPDPTLHKIEFETLPLLLNMKLRFYFFACVYPDPERMEQYYREEMPDLSKNWYLEEAAQTGKYKYDVSVLILAYNHLDYTRRCVESFLQTVPPDLNYELILVNHGSSDGTKEYFEKIGPHKQLNIAVNGGGTPALYRILEGEYYIGISNDVVLLENSIANLLRCIRSDPKIAYAVPSTPNISNLQAPAVSYQTDVQMHEFARQNNRYDPFRHEQRARLCNPIAAYRSHVLCNEFYFGGRIYPKKGSSFPDDRISCLSRRAGYRCVLVKDAYCHHFGSVTLKSEVQKQGEIQHYQSGRQEFHKQFGIDPWGTGFCFDPALIQALDLSLPIEGHTEILGLNCGLFSNPLKIREERKERLHETPAVLCGATDNPAYLPDLRGLCDTVQETPSLEALASFLAGRKFHYIVWEDPFAAPPDQVLALLLEHLASGGTLALCPQGIPEAVLKFYPDMQEIPAAKGGKPWRILTR